MFCLFFFSFLSLYFTSCWNSCIRFLDDGVIQSKEGWERAAEEERMYGESRQGGGEVILESLNCNHHLQLLPPRCSNWTSTERRGTRGGRTAREACSLEEQEKLM